MTPFSLGTIQSPDGPKAAIGIGEHFYVLSSVQPLLANITCKAILQNWPAAEPWLQETADKLSKGGDACRTSVDARSAVLLTPVMYPENLLAVGANYSGHPKEGDAQKKKSTPMPFFIRPPKTTLVGPGETVIIPKTTQQFDWECELAVFIGRSLSQASKEEARLAIAGYAIGLDLTCRDLIHVDNELEIDVARGKGQPTMAPCGPTIMPAAFVPDVDNLRIQLFVNGQKMMDSSTCEMLYKIDEQLSIISGFLPLQAGDILFTGSPSGSAGENGDRWLKPGDRIHAEIEHVGVLDVTLRDC